VLLGLGFAWLLVPIGDARAATTQIGAVAEIAAAQVPAPISSGGFGVQITEATDTYAVPPGYDAITAWTHSAGTTPGLLTFKVYRPTGALHEFLVVGSDTQTVSAGSVQSFPVQIPVQAGDRLGLSSDDVELAYETFDAGDQIGFYGADLPTGTTRATDGDPFPEFKLDVAATLTSTPPGGAPGDPGTPPGTGAPTTPGAPKLDVLSLTPASFAAARKGSSTRSTPLRGFGTKVRYRMSRAATVRFSVQKVSTGRRDGAGASARCVLTTKRNRSRAPCTRYVPVGGAFTQTARAALNSFNFTGRVNGRSLARGSYRLVATPGQGGVVGNTVSHAFRILR
jgi:hypothetical protein